jgi:hypothetical protein
LGIRVQVENTFDNLALVDSNWADLEVLFAHKHYESSSAQTQARGQHWGVTIPSIGRLCATLFSSRS